jgi:DNA-binding transcriptional ArsR family regulator
MPPYLSDWLINRIISNVVASDQLSLKFAALADPTRRGLLARLAHGEATVTELAEPFAVSLPAISRHLKVLERAGLITRRRAAQSRPTRLRIEGLREADEWMDTCRAVWEGRAQRLDAHLKETLGGGAGE